jgi:hypothetical protein
VLALTGSLSAQETNKPDTNKQDGTLAPAPIQPPLVVAPRIKFGERPKYPTDSQRLRRTIQVDGTIGDNEWDPFYTITDGPIRGTVYCNWDDDYLYLAVRSEAPCSLVFNVDAANDGWLRGADNLEIVVENTISSTAPLVTVRLLDAANSKDTPFWNEKAYDTKKILVASSIKSGIQTVEIAIPKDMGSLVLRDGIALGLRADLLAPSATPFTPSQPFEPHLLLEADLVASRNQAAGGINPTLSLSDEKCVAGQELVGTLRLLNQTDQPISVKSVQWEGVGNSVNVLNSLREVAVLPVPPTKTRDYKYKTLLPKTLSPGTYTLAVRADLENGKSVYATRTFSVVEPLQVRLTGEPQPVALVGNTKYTLLLDIFTAVPFHTKTEVEITKFPAGWVLEDKRQRGVEVDGEDKRKIAKFRVRIPSTTAAGSYDVEMKVNYGGRTWVATHTVRVLRADIPSSAPTNPPSQN